MWTSETAAGLVQAEQSEGNRGREARSLCLQAEEKRRGREATREIGVKGSDEIGEKEIGLKEKEERGLFCDGESGGDGGGDSEAERGAAAAGEGAGGQRGGSAARLAGQHSHRCLPLRNGLQGPKHPLPAACRCLPLLSLCLSLS